MDVNVVSVITKTLYVACKGFIQPIGSSIMFMPLPNIDHWGFSSISRAVVRIAPAAAPSKAIAVNSARLITTSR